VLALGLGTGSPGLMVAAAAAWGGVVVGRLRGVMRSRCPRCRRPFHEWPDPDDLGVPDGDPLVRACLSCGLPIGP
jgi:hypothetical protein